MLKFSRTYDGMSKVMVLYDLIVLISGEVAVMSRIEVAVVDFECISAPTATILISAKASDP